MNKWYPETYLEWAFLLIGMIIGVFYACGAWTNVPTQTQVPFQNSPRVRSFRWVIGAAFVSFLTDFKVFDPNVQYSKGRLFSYYLLGFAVTVAAIILAFSLVIYFKHRAIAKSLRTSTATFHPVQDFVLYGHSYYQKRTENILKEFRESRLEHLQNKLLPAYLRQLTVAINYISQGHATANDQSRKEFARVILQSMCAIVIAHNPDGDKNLQVNANFMDAISKERVPSDFFKRIRFNSQSVDSYPYFLALTAYAFDGDGNENFILPVEDSADRARTLPGAPEAFLRKRTVVVDDTATIKFSSALEPRVIEACKEYFSSKSQKFKSFASLVVTGKDGQPIGIVNIESNRTSIFGPLEDDKTRVSNLLHPFCSMLPLVLKYPQKGESEYGS